MLFAYVPPKKTLGLYGLISLDPDQADVLSGLIWVQTICKGSKQTALEVRVSRIYRVKPRMKYIHFLLHDLKYMHIHDKI